MCVSELAPPLKHLLSSHKMRDHSSPATGASNMDASPACGPNSRLILLELVVVQNEQSIAMQRCAKAECGFIRVRVADDILII